jgi:hypothetical protein
MQWLFFVTALLLIIIAYEDFKNRTVHVFLFPVLLIVAIGYAYCWLSGVEVLKNTLINACFLVVQGLLLVFYFVIKHKKWINITEAYIGWGDILFVIVTTPLFTPIAYVFFYLSSLIMTIFFVTIYKVARQKMKFIPLAGVQALWLLILLYYHQFVSPVLFDEKLFLLTL